MMKYEAILFDLDGTLIDSAADLVQTLNDLLNDYHRPPVTENLFPFISIGTNKLLALGFEEDYPIEFEVLCQQYLDRYQRQNTVKTDFFAGVPALLDAIEADNTPWGIMTNKPTKCTVAIAHHLALDQRAAAIVCGDTLSVAKPDPSPIILTCEMMGVKPENCVYIGDSDGDVTAGTLAGMETIACEYGYIGIGQSIVDWGATYIAKTPSDILKFIQ
ncbi:MAG: HAD family hydrolase [Ostreibacterium sp.]